MQCPKCHTQWPESLAGVLKFCGACGAPMAGPATEPPPPPVEVGELRYVTVLFADLTGFTSFAEDRSADEVGAIAAELMEILGGIVAQQGGMVDKYLGDAVMAIFGLPRADPTAARNAVRAGLAFQQAVTEFCATQHLNFQLRVGIHAGEVMFRTVGDSWTVMGDTVNTASRIQNVTTPGQVWISRAVYDEVRRYFTLLPRPAVELRGKRQSVQPYEVVTERATPFAEMPKFVGREWEWEQLHQTLREAVAQRTLRVIVLRGPMGVGKTRLLLEFYDWLQRQPEVYRVNVVQFDHSDPLPAHGLNTLLRQRFDLALDLDDEALGHRLRHRLPDENPFVPADQAALTVEFFALALGIADPDFQSASMEGASKWEALYAECQRWLEGWAAQEPWLLFWEDVQKGDAETLAFLEWALRVPWHAPVVVALTAREEDFLPSHPWYEPLSRWAQLPAVRELRVRELPPPVLAQALQAMGEGRVSPTLALRLAEHTEGNPLFATELVLALLEQGALNDPATAENIPLPNTVREVMEARLERLGVEGKEVAKRGALIGRRFTREAVERIWHRPPAELVQGLTTLRESEAVYEEASQLFAEEHELVFRHGRLQEAALARIPREERVRWLEGLAQWAQAKLLTLGDRWESAGPMLLQLLARAHLEKGETEAASLWYELLGWLHRKHHRPQETLQAFRLALTNADGVRRLVLTRVLADEQNFASSFAEALQTLDALTPPTVTTAQPTWPPAAAERWERLVPDELARWPTLPTVAAWLLLDLARAQVLSSLARLPEASAMFESVETQLGTLTLPPQLWQRLYLRWALGWIYLLTEQLGETTRAAAVCATVRTRVALNDPALRVEYLAFLRSETLVIYRSGRLAEAAARNAEVLQVAQATHNRRLESITWNMAGIVATGQGDLAAASQAYTQAMTISRQIGNRRGEALTLHNLGIVHYTLGEWEAARHCQTEYLRLSRVIGNRPAEAYALLLFGAIALAEGDLAQAQAQWQQAAALAQANGWQRLRADIAAHLGEVAYLQWGQDRQPAQLAQARAQLAAAESHWQTADDAGEYYTAFLCATLASGDVPAARALLARATTHLAAAGQVAAQWLAVMRALCDHAPLEPALQWFRQQRFVANLTLIARLVAPLSPPFSP